MYLMIPEVVLTSMRLAADEKIVLSYLYLLESKDKYFFGDLKYLSGLLGMPDAERVFDDLGEKNLIRKTSTGYVLSTAAKRTLEGQFINQPGGNNGKSNIHQRDTQREVGGNGLC